RLPRRPRTHRGRSSSASRARSRTSNATTASDTSGARSPRSRQGRRCRAGGARVSSSDALLGVGDTQVKGLDRVNGTQVAGECRVKAGPRNVPLVAVPRNETAARLDLSAVAARAVADVQRSLLDRQHARGEHGRLTSEEREDLATPRVDHRRCPWGSRRECVERRDPCALNVQREREPARDREADAHAGEAARADPDRERIEVARMRAALAEQRVDVLEQRLGARGPLAENFTIVDERTRRNVGRRIERKGQHSSISTTRRASPACRIRTAYRGRGSTPSPASGHSTNAIAPSKYGSRSPHSAAETPAKR